MTCGWGMTTEAATSCAMRGVVGSFERKLDMPRAEAYDLAGMVGGARSRRPGGVGSRRPG